MLKLCLNLNHKMVEYLLKNLLKHINCIYLLDTYITWFELVD